MDSEFERELKEGLYIHRPLPLHRERGLESGFPHKKVLAERDLSAVPRAEGTALLEEFPDYLRMTAPLRSERWTEGSPADGDYCSFGTARGMAANSQTHSCHTPLSKSKTVAPSLPYGSGTGVFPWLTMPAFRCRMRAPSM